MGTFWAQREGMTLRPYGAESASVFAKMPLGKTFYVEVKQPRNGKFHRLYWTLCSRIGDAVGVDAENISDLLKIETGHCAIVRSKTHGELRLPRSISYAAMDNAAFSDFFEKCIQVICSTWGIARADILDVVKDLLDEREVA